jgi:hypothetical protein
MRKKQVNATTIRLDQADREAIAAIRERSGCPSDAAAISLALGMVARGEAPLTQALTKEPGFSP